MKKCFACDVIKPMDGFYEHKAMKDGRLNKCKECTKSRVNKHRSENIDRYREYDRKRGNRQSRDYVANYRKKYPTKYKAHNMVNNAIRDGKLFAQPCEVCGIDNGSHAHHDDYAKPLNVRWLCPEHHKQWHNENGEGKNAQ